VATLNPKTSAEDILGSFWIGEGFPVDPYSLARQLGIDVYTAALPADVSGMLVKREGTEPAIYLNADDPDVRQRFTAAHELGHYMRHVGDGTADLSFVDKRDPIAEKGTDVEEVFANAFAANLLMPQGDVRRLHGEKLGPAAMARHFGVSIAALNFRLTNLGLA
jgi:Zn-dependent peptidase ImmA (M78 family)